MVSVPCTSVGIRRRGFLRSRTSGSRGGSAGGRVRKGRPELFQKDADLPGEMRQRGTVEKNAHGAEGSQALRRSSGLRSVDRGDR
jgi:hypothetical protein